ncbi:MAG: HAD family hydrolase, partial [Oscillospiraceae bacterium]|nr:HAD family hydrolase [Oscillospiraceae bacterium]
MSYNCLLLDFDDTLVSFEQSERISLTKVYNKYNIPVTEENLDYYHRENEKLWRDFEKGKIKKKDIEKTRFQKVISKFGLTGVSGDAMNR